MSDTILLKRFDENGIATDWKTATEILNEAYGGKDNVPDSKGAYIRVNTIQEREYGYRPIGIMFSCSQTYSNRDFKRGTKAKKSNGRHQRLLKASKVRRKYEEVIEEALRNERERQESRARSKKAENRRMELKQQIVQTFHDMKFKWTSEPFSTSYTNRETLEDIPMTLTAKKDGVDVEINNLTVEQTRQLAEFVKAMKS